MARANLKLHLHTCWKTALQDFFFLPGILLSIWQNLYLIFHAPCVLVCTRPDTASRNTLEKFISMRRGQRRPSRMCLMRSAPIARRVNQTCGSMWRNVQKSRRPKQNHRKQERKFPWDRWLHNKVQWLRPLKSPRMTFWKRSSVGWNLSTFSTKNLPSPSTFATWNGSFNMRRD